MNSYQIYLICLFDWWTDLSVAALSTMLSPTATCSLRDSYCSSILARFSSKDFMGLGQWSLELEMNSEARNWMGMDGICTYPRISNGQAMSSYTLGSSA